MVDYNLYENPSLKRKVKTSRPHNSSKGTMSLSSLTQERLKSDAVEHPKPYLSNNMNWVVDDTWSANFFPANATSAENIAEIRCCGNVSGGGSLQEIAALKKKLDDNDAKELCRKIIAAIQDISSRERLESITTSSEQRNILETLR
jgi:hypothetical protein